MWIWSHGFSSLFEWKNILSFCASSPTHANSGLNESRVLDETALRKTAPLGKIGWKHRQNDFNRDNGCHDDIFDDDEIMMATMDDDDEDKDYDSVDTLMTKTLMTLNLVTTTNLIMTMSKS